MRYIRNTPLRVSLVVLFLLAVFSLGIYISLSKSKKEQVKFTNKRNIASVLQDDKVTAYFDKIVKETKECSTHKLLDGKDLRQVTDILYVSFRKACLKDPEKWKRILEAKKLTTEDWVFVNSELCGVANELNPKENYWCYDGPDDCFECVLEKYERQYGKQDGLANYLSDLDDEKKAVKVREKFIRKYLYKEDVSFTWPEPKKELK